MLYTAPTIGFAEDSITIQVYSLISKTTKTIIRGGYYARYVTGGYIIYIHDSTLLSVPFDLKRLEVTGPAVPATEHVMSLPGTGVAQFSISDGGTLVYLSGSNFRQEVSVQWLDRKGKFQPLVDTPGPYYSPKFSPDGKRLAYDARTSGADIWVYDLERHSPMRLTFGGPDVSPAWTPDGQKITYYKVNQGLFWQAADGSGKSQQITDSKYIESAPAWRPDGKFLAFTQVNVNSGYDIMTVTAEGNDESGWKFGQPEPFLDSNFNEITPAFSPDGNWLAYSSDESGHFEVYVRPFPGPGGKWQISNGGGVRPIWSRTAKQLFFQTIGTGNITQTIMVAKYQASAGSFSAEQPIPWTSAFITNRIASNNYDLHPDGKRFAVLKDREDQKAEPLNKVNIIFNFTEELRRQMGGN